MDKALFLNDEKNLINIIKPKYAFLSKIKPKIVNKNVWDICYKIFGGGPEIKIFPEKIEKEKKIVYKIDLLKYIRINCIILPFKKKNFEENEYENELVNDIKIFYTFFNKYNKISDLIIYLEKIMKKHNIKLIDNSKYKFWIDINYYDFNILNDKINKKIPDIYKMFKNNDSSPLDLEYLEKENENENISYKKEFEFKFFPLNIFGNEVLMDIFPNYFTNNFESVNENQMVDLNYYFEQSNNIDVNEIKYPELNIILDQSLFFYKKLKIKYKISKCDYEMCNKKGIMTKYCECGEKFYCSDKCKKYHKKEHEKECFLFLKDINKNERIIKDQMIGLIGIKNFGNNC